MREIDSVDGDGDGFEHGSFGEGKIFREKVKDARGYGDEFGEGSGTAVIAAGDAEDLAGVAEGHVTAKAVGAGAAVHGGGEGGTVAGGGIFYVGADGFGDRGG